jgi:hypothetical protein
MADEATWEVKASSLLITVLDATPEVRPVDASTHSPVPYVVCIGRQTYKPKAAQTLRSFIKQVIHYRTADVGLTVWDTPRIYLSLPSSMDTGQRFLWCAYWEMALFLLYQVESPVLCVMATEADPEVDQVTTVTEAES